MTNEGCGSTGSTKMSIVPLLGHMLLANFTPSRISPALTPSSASKFSGCTDTMRGQPSASASRAAFSTTPHTQPPPNQPTTNKPTNQKNTNTPTNTAVTD